MKKVLLSAVILVAGLVATAQESGLKGKWLVGGTLGINSSEGNAGYKTTEFSIMPTIGYFIADDIAVGGQLGYTSVDTEGIIGDSKATGWGVGAFARKYWMMGDKLGVFAQGDVSYTQETVESGGIKTDQDGFGINARPGLTYFLSNNVAFDATVGAIGFQDYGDYGSEFNFGVDLTNTSLGILLFF